MKSYRTDFSVNSFFSSRALFAVGGELLLLLLLLLLVTAACFSYAVYMLLKQ